MNNYDNWKTESPYDREEGVNECAFCGEMCTKQFCSKECETAYDND